MQETERVLLFQPREVRATLQALVGTPGPEGLGMALPTLACSQNCSRLIRFISTAASVFW